MLCWALAGMRVRYMIEVRETQGPGELQAETVIYQ